MSGQGDIGIIVWIFLHYYDSKKNGKAVYPVDDADMLKGRDNDNDLVLIYSIFVTYLVIMC